jgi:alpha-galactosidase-like protein
VTSNGGPGDGLEQVRLTNLGTVRGGVPVSLDRAPSWNAADWGTPQVPSHLALDGLSGTAASPARPGDTFDVTGTISNDSGPDATDVSADLDLPSGWTAKPVGATHFDPLAAGTSARLHWQVTVGPDAATNTYNIAAIATYSQAGQDGRTGATYPVSVRQRGDIFVSDLPFLSSTNGWGPSSATRTSATRPPVTVARSASPASRTPRGSARTR